MSKTVNDAPPMWRPGGKPMEFLIPLAVVAAWVVLQAWVLPRLGVKT